MLHRTPLYNWHKNNNGKMVEYAGWEMPISYDSIITEHNAVRTRAGLFDVSHMGRIRVKGPDRISFVNYVSTNDIQVLPELKVQYSFICNHQGGILDDITLYKYEDYILIVCNAVNKDKILNWLIANKGNFNVTIEDESAALSMIAIQGPAAQFILQEVTSSNLNEIKYYNFALSQVRGAKVLISRTGYTGEDGFELYFGMLYVNTIWEKLLEVGKLKGLRPIGLAARDTLRTEACLPLYGNEMDEYTTPLDIRFERFVKFQKPDFIGKKAMLHSTSSEFSKRLIAFELTENGVPRKDFEIVYNDMPVGRVTSGIYSPTLKKGVGMGFVDQYVEKSGTPVQLRHKEKIYNAIIVNRPIYKRRL